EAALTLLRDPSREAYVLMRGAHLLGFLVLNMKGPFIGYIQIVCIHPAYQRQGLGTHLVRWAEERIFRDSPNVFLCVSSFNPDARRLYERLGYALVGELKDYQVAGHSEFLLRKTTGDWATFQPAPPSTR